MLRDGLSTSPPVKRLCLASSGVSTSRVPSENTRTVVLLITPLMPAMVSPMYSTSRLPRQALEIA